MSYLTAVPHSLAAHTLCSTTAYENMHTRMTTEHSISAILKHAADAAGYRAAGMLAL